MKINEDVLDRIKDKEKKIKAFGDLLSSLMDSKDKKKILWKEIYENAVTDRENAYILFHEAYTIMSQTAAEHISVGPILNKYLERMNKANDQLLKLAELIAKEQENEGTDGKKTAGWSHEPLSMAGRRLQTAQSIEVERPFPRLLSTIPRRSRSLRHGCLNLPTSCGYGCQRKLR